MAKKLYVLMILFTLSNGLALAQTPVSPPESEHFPPATETGILVDARLGGEWRFVGESVDLEQESNIRHEGTVWGGPAGDRLVVVRVTVPDQAPSAIGGAWELAQEIFDDHELIDRTGVDREDPQLPCIEAFWGSRDDPGYAGTGVTGFSTLGVLCAATAADFYIVIYSTDRFAYDDQFTVVRRVMGVDEGSGVHLAPRGHQLAMQTYSASTWMP